MTILTPPNSGGFLTGAGVMYVPYGNDITVARPATTGLVIWEGNGQPNNALATDIVVDGNAPADYAGLGFPFTPAEFAPASAGSVLTANNCYYMRSLGGGTITALDLEVVASSGNIALAVYSQSGNGRSAVPGAQKATTGSIACPPIGYATAALPAALKVNAGDFLALACDNTTATFMRSGVSATPGSAIGGGFVYRQANAFPPPANPSNLVGDRQCFAVAGVA